MTCALALAQPGTRIALLEAGARDYSEESQDAYKGEVIGDQYFPLDAARLRYFGGTSGHWGGRCRPLDDADFEVKPGIDWARWPITKADLDPYLSRASDILEIKAFSPDRPIPESGLKQISFNFSPPVHFGEKYYMRIVCDPDILLVVNANFTSFETNGNAIQAASVVNYRGVTHAIRANRYILATGGIENSRLLLWSNVRSNGQVVKNAGALGKVLDGASPLHPR